MQLGQPEFLKWWESFLREGGDREDPYDSIDRLRRWAGGLSAGKRKAFVDGLTDLVCSQAQGWHLAISVLEDLAGRDNRVRIATTLKEVPSVHPPHPLGDFRTGLLRVLARDPTDEAMPCVDAYCQETIGLGFTSVVWALWPAHRDRFARYHARYFTETARGVWAGTAVIQVFVAIPEALRALRDELSVTDPATWDVVAAEALRASTGSWVEPWRVREVEAICAA